MIKKRKGDHHSHLNQRENKGIILNGNDYRVLALLTNGEYSAQQIGEILRLPDPRSNIRYLRNAGYNIADYWEKGEFSRHKVYFIK